VVRALRAKLPFSDRNATKNRPLGRLATVDDQLVSNRLKQLFQVNF